MSLQAFPHLLRALEEQGFTKVRLFEEIKTGAREAKRHADRLTIVANSSENRSSNYDARPTRHDDAPSSS